MVLIEDPPPLQGPGALVVVAKKFQGTPQAQLVVTSLLALAQDRSWRVRYTSAERCHTLWSTMGQLGDDSTDKLLQAVLSLLQDSEVEVRCVAASKAGDVSKLVGGDLTVKKLMTPIKALTTDGAQCVRAAVAKVLMSVTKWMSRDQVQELVLPALVNLIKDVDSEVRLNLIDSIDDEEEVKMIGIEVLCTTLLPAVAVRRLT